MKFRCERGIIWLCESVAAEPDVRDALLLIVELVYDCTYICSYGKVVQLRRVTAMGWIISPVNAIVALLCIEHQTRHSWLGSLLRANIVPYQEQHNDQDHNQILNEVLPPHYPITTTLQSYVPSTSNQAIDSRAIERILEATTIKIDDRYIDDIYQLFAIDLQLLTPNDLGHLIHVLRADTGERYRIDFGARMELTCLVERTMDFLDITVDVDFNTNDISTKLYEKKGKCNNLLHANSNSAPSHFNGLYCGAMFRFVTLNSSSAEYLSCKAKFVKRLLERGYDERTIRHMQRKCRVVWSAKEQYLKALKVKQVNKKHAAIMDNVRLYTSPKLIFERDPDLLQRLALAHKNKQQQNDRIFFCKQFNRFLDDDVSLRQILTDLIDDLGLQQLEVMVSNSIHVKLGSIVL